MQEGFSFCGVDVASLGIHYAPDNTSTYVFNQTWQPQIQTFEGFHGALHYGETVQPKEFRLRCYFEDQHINEGVLDKVYNLFARGKTGKLVFSTRPWLWYVATAVSVDVSQLRNYMNGFITIVLRAYYPFARCDYLTTEELTAAGFDVTSPSLLNTSAFLSQTFMPPVSFTDVTQSTVLTLYNPGNEYAPVAVSVSGEAGSGVTITNVTTGDEMKLVAFTAEQTTDAEKRVVCDSLNGKTILTDGTDSNLNFTYHDHGFIRLAPCSIVAQNVFLTGQDNVLVDGFDFDETCVGKWVTVRQIQKSYKIASINQTGGAVLEDANDLVGSYTFTSDIFSMNEIVVQLGADAQLDTLSFSYKPTFR